LWDGDKSFLFLKKSTSREKRENRATHPNFSTVESVTGEGDIHVTPQLSSRETIAQIFFTIYSIREKNHIISIFFGVRTQPPGKLDLTCSGSGNQINRKTAPKKNFPDLRSGLYRVESFHCKTRHKDPGLSGKSSLAFRDFF
jgi:hypothetical protein